VSLLHARLQFVTAICYQNACALEEIDNCLISRGPRSRLEDPRSRLSMHPEVQREKDAAFSWWQKVGTGMRLQNRYRATLHEFM
jgi:hypothetical protein